MATIKNTKQATHNIVIVDDHPMVRQGLAMLINLHPDLSICGEAGDATEALKVVEARKPDLVLVDLSLKGRDGLDLLQDLKLRHPELPILVISMMDEAFYAERALRAGAKGYIMKQEASDKLILAIRKVLAGEIFVSGQALHGILDHLITSRTQKASKSPVSLLSNRELTVFRLIGQGYSTSNIASELCLSIKTIETYRSHIKEKLSLSCATQLVQHAINWLNAEKTA